MTGERKGLVGLFAGHPVAANLLMLMMLLGGAFALSKLNVQFFSNFSLDRVSVSVVWSGASSEDVERGITDPLEQRLRTVDGLKRMTSTSTLGVSAITLEFKEGTDPLLALDNTRRLVDELRNLPVDAEKPAIARISRYENIAQILVTGLDDPHEMRRLARRFERELLDRGIDRVGIQGLPRSEIAIGLRPEALEWLGMSLDQVAARVGETSLDLPAGIVGRAEAARDLRSPGKRRTPRAFARAPVFTDDHTRVTLGQVATIRRLARDGAVTLSVNGHPAVGLSLQRAETGNTLEAARILADWLAETRPQLPPGVRLEVYDQSWQLIRDRIFLLLENGAQGLVLVVVILFLFLNGRVAFWVAWGIPTSFMATLFVLWLAGGSINMVSLFAMIMALGVIVDDAIVVGEDALANYEHGEDPLLASEHGAWRMLAPVMASSLTTVAAFLPLMLVGGAIGKILFDIPLVVVSVLLASLLESFLVLPGHLRHAFVHMHRIRPDSLRARLDRAFDHLRDRLFRPLVTWCLGHRSVVLAGTLATLALAAGLLAGGRLKFVFFPSPEAKMLYANVTFVAGTPRARVDAFLRHLEATARATEKALARRPFIRTLVVYHGSKTGPSAGGEARGDQLGGIRLELLDPDLRAVRNADFIRAWRRRIREPAGLEQLTITPRRVGPPGRDLTVRLSGRDADTLKGAALELEGALKAMSGVREVEDDLSYGREQSIYHLTPQGRAAGLTLAAVGRQLRAAFDGRLVQIFQDGADEVEVRVKLDETDRGRLDTLRRLPIRLPDGHLEPLENLVRFEPRRGFEVLRHADGRLAVEVLADVDNAVTSVDRVSAALEAGPLPELAARHGVHYSFEGRSADQRDTLADMKRGVVLGLVLIYLVLAWVFGAYGWPLVVMVAIPFGLVGALFGHWLMGLDVTIVSLFGLFGLAGIVVNDSIILVSFYKRLRRGGMAVDQALVEAACQRLRAVLLTSLTTIAGLSPLMFETSYQAQFLIPMAVSLAFGLGFGTLLILIVVPALLSIHEQITGAG